MAFPRWVAALARMRHLVALGALVLLAACAAQYTRHGFVPSEDELKQIEVGVDTRASVEEKIGRPTSTGVLKDGAWYYIAYTIRTYAYRKPEVSDRLLVAISFDRNGRVSNIERFTLADGRAVVLSRRVTDTGIKGVSLITQLLRNVGRVPLPTN